MPARRGRFSATLSPFGGGVLNLDDAYRIEPLTATPSAPMPGAPPPREYGGGSASPWDQRLPVVGQTPVPESALGGEPEPLPSWSPAPVSESTISALDRYIANLTTSGSDPAKLGTYTTRREEYLSRGAPTVDYKDEIAALDRYIANLTASRSDPARLATYIARRADYAGR